MGNTGNVGTLIYVSGGDWRSRKLNLGQWWRHEKFEDTGGVKSLIWLSFNRWVSLDLFLARFG